MYNEFRINQLVMFMPIYMNNRVHSAPQEHIKRERKDLRLKLLKLEIEV